MVTVDGGYVGGCRPPSPGVVSAHTSLLARSYAALVNRGHPAGMTNHLFWVTSRAAGIARLALASVPPLHGAGLAGGPRSLAGRGNRRRPAVVPGDDCIRRNPRDVAAYPAARRGTIVRIDQRVSLITLGVADLARSRAFYEALGWRTNAGPDDDVVFFQAGGMILALWGRANLAQDSGVEDSGGWGGVALAYNVGSPSEVDAVIAEAGAAGAAGSRDGGAEVWGGHLGGFNPSRRDP